MIAQRLKDLRAARNYTLEDVAELIGSSKQQVARWESGQLPNAETVAKLAQAFGVTADYLLGLVDKPQEVLIEEALSSDERKLLDALRNGSLRMAMQMVLELSRPANVG